MNPLFLLVFLGTFADIYCENQSIAWTLSTTLKHGFLDITSTGLFNVPKLSRAQELKLAKFLPKGFKLKRNDSNMILTEFMEMHAKMLQTNPGSEFLQMLGSFCGSPMHGGAGMTLRQVAEFHWHESEDWLSFDLHSLFQNHVPFMNQMSFKMSNDSSSAAFIELFQDMTCKDLLREIMSNLRIYPKLNRMPTKDGHCPLPCDKRTSLLFNTPPEVYAYQRKARVETNTILVCMATGLISLDTLVQIKRDGRTLTAKDGLITGKVLPNEDSTFQRKVHVEILKSDKSNFTCEVSSDEIKLSLTEVWEIEPSDTRDPGSSWALDIGVGVVLAMLVSLLVGMALWVKYVKNSVRGPANFIEVSRTEPINRNNTGEQDVFNESCALPDDPDTLCIA